MIRAVEAWAVDAVLREERQGFHFAFRRVITTSSLPPRAVFPTVMPSAWNPSRPSTFISFCSVDVLDVAISL